MDNYSVFAVSSLLAFLASVSMVPATPEGSVTFELCATCHGNQGEGIARLGTPPLAGLSAHYVERQLRDFREGRRGSHPADIKGLLMRPMARVLLQDETLVSVSRFVASLPAFPQEKPLTVPAPETLLVAKTCLGCHSDANEVAPSLEGRGADYLSAQLDKFSFGIRGYHPEHAEGRLMGEVARLLLASGRDKDALAAYLNASGKTAPLETKEALALCASCHGPDMRGNRWLGAPSIAGLDEQYVATQLHNFRAGIRGGHPDDASGRTMSLVARLFTDSEEIETLSAQIAGMEPKPQVDTVGGDAQKGQAYYNVCMACHGPKGEGNKLLHAPSHVPLEDWYALEQLKKFKAGMRGTHDKDIWGKTMVPILATLPDEDAMRDVIAYMRSLAEAKVEAPGNE